MDIIAPVILIFLLVIILLLLLQLRRSRVEGTPLAARLDALRDAQERTDRSLRDEIARSRAEAQSNAQQERAELAASLSSFGDSVQTRMTDIAKCKTIRWRALRGNCPCLPPAMKKRWKTSV